MARPLVLAAAVAASLLAVSGAGGAELQAPKRGGTVVVLAGAELRCLNPVSEACLATSGGPPVYFEKVLEPAFVLAPDSTLRPRLVTSATHTRTPPFTVTLAIHADARWSDGVPVTASDFAFTHDAIVEHLPSELQGVHRLVRSVRPIGVKTVRVVLRSRTAEWGTLFYRVMPRHALRGQDLARIWRDGIDNPETGAPIGNGPFLLQDWERGKKITLVRNPRYWGSHTAYLDRIVIRFCRCGTLLPAPSEVLETLRSGEVDFASTREPAIASELRRIPSMRVVASLLNGVDHIAFRIDAGGHAALRGTQGKPIRRALAYGIDREAIARTVFAELRPGYPASHSAVFTKTSRYYRPNWDAYRYRPAQARRLLRQAGCVRGAGGGIFVCHGERLSIRLSGIGGLAFRMRTLELIQRQLAEVGVDVQLSFSSPGVLFDQILPGRVFQAAEFSWFPPFGIGADVYGCGRELNYTGYCQRLVTEDLNQADRTLDEASRARILNRVDRRLAEDVPVIPLYQPPGIVAHRSTIRGVVPGAGFEWNGEDWWLDD